MQPNPLRWYDKCWYRQVFGELNEDNRPQGRGIEINTTGFIIIGYYENGYGSPGNYIQIWSGRIFEVGERYIKEGKLWRRGTRYNRDGTEEQYDL